MVLLAQPTADAMAELSDGFEQRHVPGEGSLARLRAAAGAGSVDLPDDLWAWLEAGH